ATCPGRTLRYRGTVHDPQSALVFLPRYFIISVLMISILVNLDGIVRVAGKITSGASGPPLPPDFDRSIRRGDEQERAGPDAGAICRAGGGAGAAVDRLGDPCRIDRL